MKQLVPTKGYSSGASLILPTSKFNEQLAKLLAELQPLREKGIELILLNNAHNEADKKLAIGLVDQLLEAPSKRVAQMNIGATHAKGDWLFFLPPATSLSKAASQAILDIAKEPQAAWGFFAIQTPNQQAGFWLKTRRYLTDLAINLGSRLTSIATNEQLLFTHQALFQSAGGFSEQTSKANPVLSKRLKKVIRPCCRKEKVLTAGK